MIEFEKCAYNLKRFSLNEYISKNTAAQRIKWTQWRSSLPLAYSCNGRSPKISVCRGWSFRLTLNKIEIKAGTASQLAEQISSSLLLLLESATSTLILWLRFKSLSLINCKLQIFYSSCAILFFDCTYQRSYVSGEQIYFLISPIAGCWMFVLPPLFEHILRM